MFGLFTYPIISSLCYQCTYVLFIYCGCIRAWSGLKNTWAVIIKNTLCGLCINAGAQNFQKEKKQNFNPTKPCSTD